MTVDIFAYASLSEFFAAFIAHKKQQKKEWSMGIWARDLKVSKVATLTRVLKGDRQIGPELGEKLIAYFAFNEREAEYFWNLVAIAKAGDDSSQRRLAEARLRALRNTHAASAGGPIFSMNGSGLMLWGHVDAGATNRMLAAYDLAVVDDRREGLAGIGVADYRSSTLGAYRQVHLGILARRRDAKLDQSGLFYRFLFCDQPEVITFAAMAWGNIFHRAVIEIEHAEHGPVAAVMRVAERASLTLRMSEAVATADGEGSAPHAYGISNQPHYHSRYLTKMNVFGYRRLFDASRDECAITGSPLAELCEKISFRPHQWVMYSRLDAEVFGPTDF